MSQPIRERGGGGINELLCGVCDEGGVCDGVDGMCDVCVMCR